MVSLFIFHRDLRLDDNTALLECIKNSTHVIPVFIFPPEQIDSKINKYFSHPAVQFMIQSLIDLNQHLHKYGSQLYMFKGNTIDVLKNIHKQIQYTQIYSNRDYSRYAVKRDKEISDWTNSSTTIEYKDEQDYDLINMEEADGKVYKVLSPYYKKFASGTFHVRKPISFPKNVAIFSKTKLHGNLSSSDILHFFTENPNIKVKGGRISGGGLAILERIRHKDFKDYKKERDFPAIEGTTRASAYLKFGCISVREMYWALHEVGENDLIRELVFRSFYYRIYGNNLDLLNGKAYHDKVDSKIPWETNKKYYDAWKTGKTGFPLSDAGMRQLIGENWVHNRVRMLVANIATKYLLLDWRECLKYFYQNLVDADIFSNTAGWQWGSGIGVDSTPYFRAPFNPFIQSKKFDKDAEYIKRWIPELKDVAARDIHNWGDPKVRAKYPDCKYPPPLVDQKEASHKAIRVFKAAASG